MNTINESRESAQARGIGRDYTILAGWVNLLWLLYPVVFGLSDGGHITGVTGGFIFFGGLDVLLPPELSIGFLFLSRGWDFAVLQLDFSEYRSLPYSEVALSKGGRSATRGNSSST